MSHCTMPGCPSPVSRLGLCVKHYTQQWRGRDPQAFINERERLMRVDRGTGDTGKSDESRNQRENDEAAPDMATRDRTVRLPYLRFLDPAHQRVKTT